MLPVRNFISSRILAFLLLTILLIGVEVMVTQTVVFGKNPLLLSVGVLVDLVFVTTGLFYWIVSKPLRLASNRLLLIALLMLRVALFILPSNAQLPNQFWPFLLIFSEVMVLIIAGLRIRTIVQTYRQLRPATDPETALRLSMATVFGEQASAFMLGEGVILYYVLFGWRLQADVPTSTKPLTTHRQSGQLALTVGLLVVGLIEEVAVHLLVARWNPTAAVWITIISAYGMLFFVADAIATAKRPSYLSDTHLQLRLGVRWRATILRSQIAHVSFINEKPAKQSGLLNGAFLTSPNLLFVFTEPITFIGPYGIQKKVSRFTIFVDDRTAFNQYLCRE
ncbi:hypothetical protein EXU85_34050 [Spirosoma sp. KCTC 42546]|uniref:hypothetical protein n=1 Tax=Spirosoma sp. KCTC 42546 TaxID=2520506 RepID=UPI0011571C65|nr:hypothetical protein [Spirosoma sp. KCTC 42546]QDK83359.1 hypothetical protein EXU85_34050 [Spirosoma sp. KCTC 42546]